MNPLKWLLVTIGAALIYGTVVIIDAIDPKFDLSLADRSFIQTILAVAGAITGLAVVLERMDRERLARLDRIERRLEELAAIVAAHRDRMEREVVDAETAEAAKRLNGRLSVVERL